MLLEWASTHPIGLHELESQADSRYRTDASSPLLRQNAIRCCVRDCDQWLAKRKRGKLDPGAICPNHGISVSTSPTYVYEDYRDNFIIGLPVLEAVKPFKVESWRLGNERSEDALSWNCFLGLVRLNGLASVFETLTGLEASEGLELYLWGVKISDEAPRILDRLIEGRKTLEKGAGIPTEPDIILRAPGRAIVLIEAKFGSPNGTMSGQEERFGDVWEFLDSYPAVQGKADPLNRDAIMELAPERVYQQLVRNVIFAQWLAAGGEIPYVVNLVRSSEEKEIEVRFSSHLADDRPVRFRRWTWEELYRLPALSVEDAIPLRHYLKNKSNRLVKAFDC